MKGGVLKYAYTSIEAIATQVDAHAETVLHRVFANHLRDVGQALHDLDWVWSGDLLVGGENPAIKKCINWQTEGRLLIKRDIEKLRKELNDLEAVIRD